MDGRCERMGLKGGTGEGFSYVGKGLRYGRREGGRDSRYKCERELRGSGVR